MACTNGVVSRRRPTQQDGRQADSARRIGNKRDMEEAPAAAAEAAHWLPARLHDTVDPFSERSALGEPTVVLRWPLLAPGVPTGGGERPPS